MEAVKANPDSYSWQCPQAAVELACQKQIKQGEVIIPRVLPLIALIECILYIYLKHVLPDDLPLKARLLKMFMFTFLYAAVPLLIYFVVWPRICPYLRRSEHITDKWFKWSDKQIRWKWLDGFWIADCEDIPGLKKIFFRRAHRLYSIYLPDNADRHAEIIQFISTRIPLIEPVYPVMTLSKKQHLFCWSFTVVFAFIAALACVLASLQQYLRVFFWVLLLCPGTIAMAIVLGKKFYKDRRFSYAFVMNMAAMLLFLSFVFLVQLYKYHKIIQGR